ncbi:hypothetical protein GCM10028794_19080 [Silanimonas algicola]
MDASNHPPEGRKDAVRRISGPALAKGYQPEALHEYRDANGKPVLWRIRLRHPETGGKWIRPMYWNGSAYVGGEPPAPASGRPLYRLPEMLTADPKAPVFVVEGETCADALHRLGLVAVTSGGASSDGRADWRPLQGRRVILWPDHDEPGRKYADRVSERLSRLGAACECLDVAALGLPEKGDAVDWTKAHPEATSADVLALPRAIPEEPEREGVQLRCMADVEMRPVEWLWPGWLARGKLHVLAGSPGTGKTTIALDFAATISKGGRWPDGEQCNGGKPAHVLVWSGEDDPADTIAPRLAAAGADMCRVHAIESVRIDGMPVPFDPAEHLPELAARMAELGDVGLLIVDPIVSAVGGDTHKNGEVRRALEPLVRLGQDFGCAVLGISHFSKGTNGKDPTERVTGSIAFGALARVVLGTVKPREEGEPRLMVRTKANIGPDTGGFAYVLLQEEVRPGLSASCVAWGDAVEGSARDLIREAEGSDGERKDREDATEWLAATLNRGPMPSRQVRAAADEAGHAWRTVQRAMRSLRVHVKRDGFGRDGKTLWALPHSRQSVSIAPDTPHFEDGANGAT